MTMDQLLTCGYFPARDIPFSGFLDSLFFNPSKEDRKFPIHGPNAIRFVEAMFGSDLRDTPGLLRGDPDRSAEIYEQKYPTIMEALGVNMDDTKQRVLGLMRVAALYHDIGKFIHRENHPAIGSNLMRDIHDPDHRPFVDALTYGKDSSESDSRHNRFSLIASIVQHHDKFGVVSTGEGALPLFSDILYFTSDGSPEALDGIRKNVTSVMLLNLVDIAAVVSEATDDQIQRASALAKKIWGIRRNPRPRHDEQPSLEELASICLENDTCLGLTSDKLTAVLEDWTIVKDAIGHPQVEGNRVRMKSHLLELERVPSRAIKRIFRLLQECALTSNCSKLMEGSSPYVVESVLVGTLGAHRFQSFCDLLSTVAKLDYGLDFFRAILCACARIAIARDYRPPEGYPKPDKWPWQKLTDRTETKDGEVNEIEAIAALSSDELAVVANKVVTLFVRVLEGLLTRYDGVLGCSSSDPRRFGFQMRGLHADWKILSRVLRFLCQDERKDAIAMTWISEEVTIWSMD